MSYVLKACIPLIQKRLLTPNVQVDFNGSLHAAIQSRKKSLIKEVALDPKAKRTRVMITYMPAICGTSDTTRSNFCTITPDAVDLENTKDLTLDFYREKTAKFTFAQMEDLCNKDGIAHGSIAMNVVKGLATQVIKDVDIAMLADIATKVGQFRDGATTHTIKLINDSIGTINFAQYSLMQQYLAESGITDPIFIGGGSMMVFSRIAQKTGTNQQGINLAGIASELNINYDVNMTGVGVSDNLYAMQAGIYTYVPFSRNVEMLMTDYIGLGASELKSRVLDNIKELASTDIRACALFPVDGTGEDLIPLDIDIRYECEEYIIRVSHSWGTMTVPFEQCANANMTGIVKFDTCPVVEATC